MVFKLDERGRCAGSTSRPGSTEVASHLRRGWCWCNLGVIQASKAVRLCVQWRWMRSLTLNVIANWRGHPIHTIKLCKSHDMLFKSHHFCRSDRLGRRALYRWLCNAVTVNGTCITVTITIILLHHYYYRYNITMSPSPSPPSPSSPAPAPHLAPTHRAYTILYEKLPNYIPQNCTGNMIS